MLNPTARTWAEIDTQALLHNLSVARQHTEKKLMCVIKGDAHGHGAVACGKALEKAGVDAFAVACQEEGIALRKAGITASILGPWLCKLFRLTDDISRGVAFGTASHVIGTSRVNEVDPLAGAVSSLSLAVAGILTAVVFPFVLYFL